MEKTVKSTKIEFLILYFLLSFSYYYSIVLLSIIRDYNKEMHQIIIDLLTIIFTTPYGVVLIALYLHITYANSNHLVRYKNLNLPLYLVEYFKYKFHDSTRAEIGKLYKVVLVTYYSFLAIITLPILVISFVIYLITRCVLIVYSYTRHSQESNFALPVYSVNDTNSYRPNVNVVNLPPPYTIVEFSVIEAYEETPPYEAYDISEETPPYEERPISDLSRDAVISTRV
uniref:Uncharacterized protein n=1 Tax=viral metagenome TaxID=1070528 RepID=A0A6C0EY45_9ZZZZ